MAGVHAVKKGQQSHGKTYGRSIDCGDEDLREGNESLCSKNKGNVIVRVFVKLATNEAINCRSKTGEPLMLQ